MIGEVELLAFCCVAGGKGKPCTHIVLYRHCELVVLKKFVQTFGKGAPGPSLIGDK